MGDISTQLAHTVAEAYRARTPLKIRGGGSKADVLGRDVEGTPLDIAEHSGVIDYNPAELVLTARAGTPIAEINKLLGEQGQQLPPETPALAGKATLGGSLACNHSGPARPWQGSLRDMVLGTRLINGRGEQLRFGGQGMKNVAGYDVSRMQAGALGTLAVITELSLKVLPRPETTKTLAYSLSAHDALDVMRQRATEPRPLNAACWFEGTLYLRLSGAKAAVESTAQLWGGDSVEQPPWQAIADGELPCLNQAGSLYRLSVPTGSALALSDSVLIDWGGAQRWVYDQPEIVEAAVSERGHAWLYRGGDRKNETAPPLTRTQRQLHTALKNAMDPEGILNPGRLYSWL